MVSRINIDTFFNALKNAIDRKVQVNLLTTVRFSKKRKNPLNFLTILWDMGVQVVCKSLVSIEDLENYWFPKRFCSSWSEASLKIYRNRKYSDYLLENSNSKHVKFSATSNFTPDYFFHDTGLALVITETEKKVLYQIESIFNRYWTSDYSTSLRDYIRSCSVQGCHI